MAYLVGCTSQAELPVALSPRIVPLVAWGSQENSGAPEDLQAGGASRAASATSDQQQHGTSSSTSTTSDPPAGQLNRPQQQELLDLQPSPIQLAAAAGDHQAVLWHRNQAAGHRSLPGVSELHPQEVIVKVQVVQQRSNADGSGKHGHVKAQSTHHHHNLHLHPPQQQQQLQPHLVSMCLEPESEQQQQQQQQGPQHIKLAADPPNHQLSDQDGQDAFQQSTQSPTTSRTSRSSSSRGSIDNSHPSHARKRLVSVPVLDLSKAQIGKPAGNRAVLDPQPLTRAQAERDAELCLEHGSSRRIHLHPNAPMQDNRCYHYRAMGAKDVTAVRGLLARLSPRDAAQVQDIWDSLLMARRDCEAMAARGVRVSRDISRDWQETVSDLIDRVVAQDNELGQLRQQLKSSQASTSSHLPLSHGGTSSCSSTHPQHQHLGHSTTPGTGGSTNGSSVEDLHSQVVRLKRHRDRLMRDTQELSRELAETKLELQGEQIKAADAQDQLAYLHQQAQDLYDQHVTLLQQHIALAAYAEDLEAATGSIQQQQQVCAVGQCPQPLQAIMSAAAGAAAAPPGFVAAQGLGGWVLKGIGQESSGCIGGFQGAARSSSAPLSWGTHKQQQVQQPLSKLSRLQSPQIVLGLPVMQQPGAVAAAAALPVAAAGSIRSSSVVTLAGSVPEAGGRGLSTASKWLHSSLSTWVHLGHRHRHPGPTRGPALTTTTSGGGGSKQGSFQGLAASRVVQQQVGLDPSWSAIGAGAAPETGFITGLNTCRHVFTAAEPSTATAGSRPTASADIAAGLVPECRQAWAANHPQQLSYASVPEPPASAAVRRTLEQAAAVVAATLAAAAPTAGPGGKVGRQAAVSCPGQVAFSKHLLSASAAGGAAAASMAAMCPSMSIDIPQQASRTDHTPRCVCAAKGQAAKTARHTPRPSGRGCITDRSSWCGCEGVFGSGLELMPASTTDLHFDQAEGISLAVGGTGAGGE